LSNQLSDLRGLIPTSLEIIMAINHLFKGIIGASIALALAGGAQATGQENASTTAPDKTQNDASTPKKSMPKAKKTAKKSKSTTTSQGSSTSGQSGQTGNSGTTGTMDNGTDTATDPNRTGGAGTSGTSGTSSAGGVIDNSPRSSVDPAYRPNASGMPDSTGTRGTTGMVPPDNSGATPTNTGR
jgi:cytoskeletal protein RodZ